MKSIFQTINFPGKPIDLIGAVQIMFDEASAQRKVMFEKTFIDEWFKTLPPQYGLTVQALVGKYNIRFMASIIGDKAGTPLRPTRGFEQFLGTIPRIGHKFPLDADTIRTYMAMLENTRLKADVKVNQFQDLLMNNVQDAYLGCKDAASSIVLQALSNFGIAQFNELNNPDGRAYEVDYRLPEDNKVISTIDFTDENINDVDVLAFLHKLHFYYLNKGITFGELLLSPEMLYWILSTPKLRRVIHGRDKSDDIVSEEQLNQALQKRGLPPVRCIVKLNAINKDGRPNIINHWNGDFMTLIPSGGLGEIQPAFEDNQIIQEQDVTYIDATDGIRIAKWSAGDSTNQTTAEYTQASWRALPIIKAINNVVCIKVRNTNGEGRELIVLGSSGAAPTSAAAPTPLQTGNEDSSTAGSGESSNSTETSIDLTQNAQTVIKAVKACEDIEALKVALETELAKESPRKTVTEAIEDRIEELENAGE